MHYIYFMSYFSKTLALISLAILMFLSVKSQNKSSDQLKNIKTLYPDKKFYAIREEISYDFELEDNKLTILENFNSILVSPEYNNQRFHSVFYDDYSEVKKVTCNADGQANPQLNVIYTNYESNGIFHDDLKLCAFKMEMDKDVHYKVKYEKLYKNPRFFTRVFFHENYPIAEKVIKFKIPNWVNVEIKPINFESYNIIVETEKNDGKSKTVTYTLKNVNSTPNENHAPSILKYLPHLLIFIKSHNNGQQLVKYFNNQDDVYAWNHILSNAVENKEKELLPILNNILKDEQDSLKMMEKIFYWVQDNVRYIAFEEGIMGYKPAAAEKVCNLLYGDCKGMANLTKTLLKLAGFEARLTWIGTDNIPYDNNLPTLAVYNHMICTVIFREKKYFLDATESYIALNDYAERIQNRPCMIESGNSYLNEKIPNLNFERNLQEEKIEYKILNYQLVGKSKSIYSGEVKTDFLRRFNEMRSSNSELALKNNFTTNNPNLVVENIKTSDINERANPLNINYDLTLRNSVIKGASNQLYVFMIKDHDLAQLYFDSTRVCDYEFNLKYFISDIYSLECPPGFKPDKLPKSLEIDNSIFAFSLGYEVKENKITLNKTIKIKSGSISKKDFNTWNEAITQARNFYNSPVVLTQK